MSLIFAFPNYTTEVSSLRIPFLERGNYSFDRFLNQEYHLTLHTPVQGKNCYLYGSIGPPDTNLLFCMILSHTLKKEGALRSSAIFPYLAYARHEHNEKGKSQITSLLGTVLPAAGIDEIITIDVHSVKVQELFPIPIISLDPSALFAKELEKVSFIPDLIVAPDIGAKERCACVAKSLYGLTKKEIPVFCLSKKREQEKVIHEQEIEGKGKKVLIVDDILDTGETLVSCVKRISSPQEIVIVVSHGLLVGEKWKELFTLGVKKLFLLNNIASFVGSKYNYPIEAICACSIIEEYLCKSHVKSP